MTVNWLELKGAAGRHSPVLVEHYQALEQLTCGSFVPRIITSIGGLSQGKFFGQSASTEPPCPAVSVGQFLGSTVFFGGLHDARQMTRMIVRPQSASIVQHSIQSRILQTNSKRKVAEFASILYWQLLAPFSTAIFLFLDDLGGISPVIEILARWMNMANEVPCIPQILILYNPDNGIDTIQFRQLLSARLRPSRTSKGCSTAISSLHLLSTCAIPEIKVHLEEGFGRREKAGYAFSEDHARHLLHLALQDFSSGLSVDLIRDARSSNPPPSFSSHVFRFMKASRWSDIDQVAIIASALELNAHPSGMHCESKFIVT